VRRFVKILPLMGEAAGGRRGKTAMIQPVTTPSVACGDTSPFRGRI